MYGTATPIPFKVVIDPTTGVDVDIAVRCNGEYSFKIINPVVFYQNVAGNKADIYDKEDLLALMKSEMIDALNPAFGKLSALGIRYSELPLHTTELKDAICEVVNKKWEQERGIAFQSITINSVTVPEADAERIKNAQFAMLNKDPNMANATIIQATADAMRDAANNANGAATGFMNVNMAQNVASGMIQQTGGNGGAQAAAGYCPHCGKPIALAGAKFCSFCGKELQ